MSLSLLAASSAVRTAASGALLGSGFVVVSRVLVLRQHVTTPWQHLQEQQQASSRRTLSTSTPWQQHQEQQQQASSRTAEVGRLNHVAIAVPDLEKAADRYRNVLGCKVSAPQPVPEHGVTVVFVELPNTKIELLHPLGDRSPISKFLERNPAGGIHHVCLEVADVRHSLQALTPAGVRVLDPEPKIGAHGNPVVFLHPKDNDGVLTELEEVGADRVEGQQQPS